MAKKLSTVLTTYAFMYNKIHYYGLRVPSATALKTLKIIFSHSKLIVRLIVDVNYYIVRIM